MDLAQAPPGGQSLQQLQADGAAALRRGDAEAAQACYRALLTIDPRDIHALVGLGIAAKLENRPDLAIARLEEAIAAFPSHPWPHLEMGNVMRAGGRAAEAEDCFRRALELSPGHFHVLMALGNLLEGRGDFAEAIEKFRAAADAEPLDVNARTSVASTLAKAGRNEEAVEAFRAIADDQGIPVETRSRRALTGARIARDRLHDRAGAVALLELATTLDPEANDSAAELAQQYRIGDRFDEAKTLYERILARDPEHAAALTGLATVRRLGRDPQGALPLIEAACRLNPGQVWNRLERGYVLRDMGRVAEAAKDFESFGGDEAPYGPARMALAQMARGRGDHKAAADYFDQAASVVANPAVALRNLAETRLAAGDHTAADRAVARLLAVDPLAPGGYMTLGGLKRAMRDREGARAAFARAAELDEGRAQPHVELAVEAMAENDFEAAEASLDRALAVEPAHRDAWLKRASLRTRQGDRDAALEIYARLCAEAPEQAWPWLAAAELRVRAGETEAALATLASARAKGGANAQIECRDAAIYRQIGQFERSQAILDAAIAQFPDDFWLWQARASLAIDLGRFDDVEAMLASPPSARTPQERGHVEKLRAKAWKMQWALAPAEEALDAALACDPDDASAHDERAKLRLLRFDLAGAGSDLKTSAEMRSASAPRRINPLHSHTGQLYEEFILDRDVVDRLDGLRDTPPAAQIAPLLELAGKFPDSTAPAIGLMVALRRSGRLNRAVLAGDGSAPRIPRLITRYWNDAVPPADIAALMAGWRECEPRFAIDVFDDASALAWLRAHCAGAAVRAFERAQEPAQRADLFRLARLNVVGGFFIDADDRARGGLSAHVPPSARFFAHQEEPGSLGNNLLGAAPRHPVIARALEQAATAILRGDRDIIWLTTGPGLLTRAFAQWLARAPAAIDENLASAFIPTLTEVRAIAAIHCDAAYKTTHRAWLSGAFRKAQGQ